MRTVAITATPELKQYEDEINSWLNEVSAEQCEAMIRTILIECFDLDEEFVRTIEYNSDEIEGDTVVYFDLPLPPIPDELVMEIADDFTWHPGRESPFEIAAGGES